MTTYGNVFDGESYVFTASGGGQVRQSTFRKVFKAAQARAGIREPKARVHSLRHTAASLMAQQGFSLVEAGRQLGHTVQAMTERYTALWPGDRAEKAARLDAAFRAGA